MILRAQFLVMTPSTSYSHACALHRSFKLRPLVPVGSGVPYSLEKHVGLLVSSWALKLAGKIPAVIIAQVPSLGDPA